MDRTAPASFEETRLPNKLLATDAESFSAGLLKASGFDQAAATFSAALCNSNVSGAATYSDAVNLIHQQG
jgi:hypothetical protein